VPVVRTRAPGISQLVSLADKVKAWATATDVEAAPLLACLEQAMTTEPEDIVAAALVGLDASAAHPDADAQGGPNPAKVGLSPNLVESS
jgi:DNA repair protein SbcD/Mre11